MIKRQINMLANNMMNIGNKDKMTKTFQGFTYNSMIQRMKSWVRANNNSITIYREHFFIEENVLHHEIRVPKIYNLKVTYYKVDKYE